MSLTPEFKEDTFGQRLRKSRSELGLSISDVATLFGVTNSIISGYELERYMPTKDILDKLFSKFDMDYLRMEGYTKLILNFNDFLNTLNSCISKNNLTK
ncbi:MAG: helix-turn-helix transcriptional regulator [Romboutsia sp.]